MISLKLTGTKSNGPELMLKAISLQKEIGDLKVRYKVMRSNDDHDVLMIIESEKVISRRGSNINLCDHAILDFTKECDLMIDIEIVEIKVGYNGNERLRGSTLILLSKGETLHLEAVEDAKFLVISGRPINEEIARGGPFVMNTREEILEAIQDYQNGTFIK